MTWRTLTMLDERLNFINRVFSSNNLRHTFSELCDEFGISPKTGYKWIGRFKQNGTEGLKDLSKAPHTQTCKISTLIEEEIVRVRTEFPQWGPKKIRIELIQTLNDICVPSEGSIGNILKKHSLSRPRNYRRHVAQTSPLMHCLEPNDVWMYDFKGWFKTGDDKICEPLTITDGFSRYLIKCQHMNRKRTQDVWEVLKDAFNEYGLPKKIRSDNGPPFATTGVGRLSPLAIKLIKIGVVPEWIEPGCPEQNGRHERMHLTLKNETAKPPAATLTLQIYKMEQFQKYFNFRRPHEALGQVVPAAIYIASNRKWDGKFTDVKYTPEYEVRRVCKGGSIGWKGIHYFLSESLYGELIGIKEIDIGIMGIFYGPIMLGVIDFTKGFTRL